MIFCNGVQKSGTHALISYLQKTEGLPVADHRTIKAYRKWHAKPPAKPLNALYHCHLAAGFDLPGRVITIFRNPRNCLVSYSRWAGVSIREALDDYAGRPFIYTYNLFLGWLEKGEVVRFEELEKTNDPKSITYTGRLSDWRECWNTKIEKKYQRLGGHNLDKRAGYAHNLEG